MAYDVGEVALHAMVKVRLEREINGVKKHKLIENTVGRLIFNESIPQDLGLVKRDTEDSLFELEVDPKESDGNLKPIDKKMLGKIIDKCFRSSWKHKDSYSSR